MPTTSAHISMQIKVICPPERNHSMWIGQASLLHPRWHKRAQGRHVDVLQDISFPLPVEGARAFALWLPGETSSMFVYGEPAGRVILVRAALLRKPHGCHARTFPNDGGIKKHGGSMSEGLASYQGHFPVDDRAFECLPSAKVRREGALPWHQEHKRRRVRSSTRADGQDRTGRSTASRARVPAKECQVQRTR